MAGVACLGKASEADEWCDSGLGSLGPDAAAPGGPGLGAELGPGLSWAPLVFGYVTEDGDTALHLAVIHQHEPFLDFLLGFAAGTEYLDLQNDLGQTALHLAAILGEASTVEKLYAAGAGLHVAERGGHTALHLACRTRAHACARVLLQPRPRCARGAPNTYLAQGPDRTSDADHSSVALYPEPDSEKEDEESEEDWKLQLEAENYEGHTPLHVAVIHKDAEMVRLLREAGADLNKPEPTCGRSPLHLAVEAHAVPTLPPACMGAAPHWAVPRSGPTPSLPAFSVHMEPLSPRTRTTGLAPAAAVATVTAGTRAMNTTTSWSTVAGAKTGYLPPQPQNLSLMTPSDPIVNRVSSLIKSQF
uniref:NFKB inhibitor beta n=1 Tax=Ursus maritimus TaxID=29073 RepID=A0A452UZ44_URSMA